MRRLPLFVGVVLAGGVWAASAAAAPGLSAMSPAPTSVDRAPVCAPVAAAPVSAPVAGGTSVTFTLVAPGCEP